MTKKATTKQHTYEEAVSWLREHGFDILDAPGTKDRVFLKKYNCSAAIEKAPDGNTHLFAKPGYLIGGEIARLAGGEVGQGGGRRLPHVRPLRLLQRVQQRR